MGLFGSKKEGGIMDVIKCEKSSDYLIWKWSPGDVKSHKESAIRYGSKLVVQDSEVAVFVYAQKDGTMQDYVEGPFQQSIKTANFPVLTSIVGAAYGGDSPFHAEVYFINLAGVIQIPFFTSEVEIIDPNFAGFVLPAGVRGVITVNITDYKSFIHKNRLATFTRDDLAAQIKPRIVSEVASSVGRCCEFCNLKSALEASTYRNRIGDAIVPDIRNKIESIYGVNLLSIDLESINIDKESESYQHLYKSLNINTIKNVAYSEAEIANADDYAKRANEERQRRAKLETETAFMAAHQLNIQGDVAKTAAESLGTMGSGMGGDGGGFNPAAMMAGMMMGTTVGGHMANTMSGMMQGVNAPQPPPPPGMVAEYHIVGSDGKQSGPYNMQQLKQMVSHGMLTRETYMWKQGMAAWDYAGNVPEVAGLFAAVPPPPPPPPPVPRG